MRALTARNMTQSPAKQISIHCARTLSSNSVGTRNFFCSRHRYVGIFYQHRLCRPSPLMTRGTVAWSTLLVHEHDCWMHGEAWLHHGVLFSQISRILNFERFFTTNCSFFNFSLLSGSSMPSTNSSRHSIAKNSNSYRISGRRNKHTRTNGTRSTCHIYLPIFYAQFKIDIFQSIDKRK